jgi:chromosome segregation ATPase
MAADMGTVIALAVGLVGSAGIGGIIGAILKARSDGSRLELDAQAELRKRIVGLEEVNREIQEKLNAVSVELGELRGDLRARDGEVQLLRDRLAERTDERDEARAERDSYKEQRDEAMRALHARAPDTAEVLLADADEARSLPDSAPEGWEPRGLGEVTSEARGEDA